MNKLVVKNIKGGIERISYHPDNSRLARKNTLPSELLDRVQSGEELNGRKLKIKDNHFTISHPINKIIFRYPHLLLENINFGNENIIKWYFSTSQKSLYLRVFKRGEERKFLKILPIKKKDNLLFIKIDNSKYIDKLRKLLDLSKKADISFDQKFFDQYVK